MITAGTYTAATQVPFVPTPLPVLPLSVKLLASTFVIVHVPFAAVLPVAPLITTVWPVTRPWPLDVIWIGDVLVAVVMEFVPLCKSTSWAAVSVSVYEQRDG